MDLRNWMADTFHEGPSVVSGRMTVTPISRALVVLFPGTLGGLIWNRPSMVRVSRPGQPDEIIRIRDDTRLALFAITGISLLGILLAAILTYKERS